MNREVNDMLTKAPPEGSRLDALFRKITIS
jgi:hypothetical protein